MNNSREKLEKHLQGKKLYLIMALVALVISVVGFGYLGLQQAGVINKTDVNQVRAFNPEDGSQDGEYVALSIIAIDDWAAQHGDDYYFLAKDTSGYLNVVKLDFAKYAQMIPQQNYWEETMVNNNDAAEVPEPYVLYGIVAKNESELLETLAATYNMDAEKLEGIVGSYHLLEGVRPGEKVSKIMWWLALGGAGGTVLFLLLQYFFNKTVRKTLDHLEKRGELRSALSELEDLKAKEGNKRIFCGENYIYHFGDIFHYDDILWAYEQVQKRNFVVVSRNTTVKTKDGKSYILLSNGGWGEKSKTQIVDFLQFLSSKNPNMLLGYSKENEKRYAEMVKGQKKSFSE